MSAIIESEGAAFHDRGSDMRYDSGLDPNDTLVICVSPGLRGKWDVSEKGFEVPIASFADMEEAYAFAAELTKSRKSAAVLLEDDDGFQPLYLTGLGMTSQGSSHAFNSAG
jgi:hypothetical protein